jgi:bleomycin hydrolase
MGAQSSKDYQVEESNEKVNTTTDVLSQQLARLNLDEAGLDYYPATLSSDALAKYSKHFAQDSKNLLARNAIVGTDPTQVMLNPKAALQDQHVFNVKLDLEGSATNQKSSGRCWLFAGCNVMRLAVIQKYKLSDDFELSQSYLFFYGKPPTKRRVYFFITNVYNR